jgi:hypothetical protein
MESSMVLNWSNDPAAQKSFVQQLDKRLLQLGQLTDPTTLYSETEPLSAQLASATYERTQWVVSSENRLRNTYIRVEDGAAANTTTYTPYPIVPVPVAGSKLVKLGSFSNENAVGPNSFAFTNIPQTYKHLFLYVHYRDTNNALSINANLRVNASAAALYSMSWHAAQGSVTFGTEQVSATGWVFQTPANIVAGNYTHNWLDGWFEISDYASTNRTAKMRGRVATAWGQADVNNTFQGYEAFGIWNSLAAITGISWTGTTGSAAGTRLALYAI